MTKTKEKPLACGARIYKEHRSILADLAKKLTKKRGEKVSEAQVVREAIVAFQVGSGVYRKIK